MVAYNGFISYSHAGDGRLAPALQKGLQRLAKRWNSRRALRVFRDETGLSTNPHLWSAIETALDGSGWFVLLASPESAASEWVSKEVAHWVATKPVDRILPVVTDGTWEWDADRGDFTSASTAVPAALRGALREEARYLDLRWARGETDLDLRNSRFRAAVADLAAPMHGIAKDDLEGEDIRQHRRTRRIARGAVAVLVLLLVVALIATAFAVRATDQANRARDLAQVERNQANQQRNAAELATDDALAGGLTAKVDSLLGAGQYDLALLLAVEANNAASHLPPSSPVIGTTQDVLVHSLAAQPTLSRTLASLDGRLANVVYSPDGKTIVSQSGSGAFRVWDAVTGAPRPQQPPPESSASVLGVALNDAGVMALPGDAIPDSAGGTPTRESIRLWDLRANRPWRLQPPATGIFTVLALSDSGLLAMGTAAGPALGGVGSRPSQNTIRIWNINTGDAVGGPISVPGSVDAMAFSADGTRLGADLITADASAIDLVLVDATTGALQRRFVAHAGSTQPSPNTHLAFDHYDAGFFDAVVFSPDGRQVSSVVARAKDGGIATFDAATGSRVGGSPASQTATLDGVSPDLRELVEQTPHADLVVDAATGAALASYPRDNTTGIGVNPTAVDPVAPHLVYQPGQQGSLAVLDWTQLGSPYFETAASTQRLAFPVLVSPTGQLLGAKDDPPLPTGDRAFTSPAGYAAILSNDRIVLNDPRLNRTVRTLTDVPSGCTSAPGPNFVFTGTPTNGRVAIECPHDQSAFAQATLLSWDLSDPRSAPQWRQTFVMPNYGGYNIPFLVASSDGNTLGVMGALSAQVVDGRTGRLVATGPAATGGQLERLALSPDTRTLATIDYSGHVQLLDTATGTLRHTLTSSTGNAANPGFAGDPELAFSPDGAYLAVWSDPIGLEVWDLRTGASIGVLDGRATVAPFTTSLGTLYGFDLGPYTQLVVTFGAADASVTVTGERRLGAPPDYLIGFPGDGPSAIRTVTWSMKPSDWERAACTIAGRDLTTDEWNQYVGASVPYHRTCTPLLPAQR